MTNAVTAAAPSRRYPRAPASGPHKIIGRCSFTSFTMDAPHVAICGSPAEPASDPSRSPPPEPMRLPPLIAYCGTKTVTFGGAAQALRDLLAARTMPRRVQMKSRRSGVAGMARSTASNPRSPRVDTGTPRADWSCGDHRIPASRAHPQFLEEDRVSRTARVRTPAVSRRITATYQKVARAAFAIPAKREAVGGASDDCRIHDRLIATAVPPLFHAHAPHELTPARMRVWVLAGRPRLPRPRSDQPQPRAAGSPATESLHPPRRLYEISISTTSVMRRQPSRCLGTRSPRTPPARCWR